MNISLVPEKVFEISGYSVTNSLLSGFIVTVILALLIIIFSRTISIYKPSKLQLIVETIFVGLKSVVQSVLGPATKLFWPLVLTFFIFIFFSNLFGLLPITGTIGFLHKAEGTEELVPFLRAPTSDISATLALSLISIVITNIVGIKFGGFKYLKKFFNFSSGMNFFVGILELVSEMGKLISFTFRLFGNVFAGEVLLLVITNISHGIATLPFFGLELFIVFIQAFVFFMLTSVFISLALKPEH